MPKRFILKKHVVPIFLCFLLCSCSTRQVREKYAGSTEQRLTSISINRVIGSIPEKDFSLLKGKKIFLNCHFLEKSGLLDYAKKRLELELMEKYNCRMVQKEADAEFKVHVFFTSLGTDSDKFGLSLPDMVLPVVGGISSIDLIALDKYHGISELYYYVVDKNDCVMVKGSRIKSVTKNDSLSLPLITIPISTVK